MELRYCETRNKREMSQRSDEHSGSAEEEAQTRHRDCFNGACRSPRFTPDVLHVSSSLQNKRHSRHEHYIDISVPIRLSVNCVITSNSDGLKEI